MGFARWLAFARAHLRGQGAGVAEAAAARTEVPAPRSASPNRFFYQSMGAMCALLLLTPILCVASFRYSIPAPGFDVWAGYVSIGMAIGYCRWAHFERLLEASWMIFWSRLLAELLEYPMYLGARSRLPLADHALAHIDQAIGFQVPAILHWVVPHPWVRVLFSQSYNLLFLIIVLGAVVPALRYRWTAVKELLVATVFSTLAGSVLFALAPAVGPWTVYGFPPSALQSTCQNLFLTLRSGVPYLLNENDTGIICFPSFHALLAVLSCVALCSIRPLRIPAILVTVAIILSTLVTGWHYVTDVIAGLLLAALAVAAAKFYTRVEAKVTQARVQRA